ncbi:hypothetical protein NA78x_004040 [Anatilimnocola sp. NA78]|uniref:hypothetical protein n=1 Tax=Anatilimnocola sp. NA78 TaxID=3415683 RepID=UPI003CE4EAD5
MPPDIAELWQFLPWGFLLTIVLETPVLLLGLSQRHSWQRRLFAGVWLTACTYPIVVVLLPLTVWHYWGETAYLVVAETFAPIAECLIFVWAFAPQAKEIDGVQEKVGWQSTLQDCAAIVAANLFSFLFGGFLIEQMKLF